MTTPLEALRGVTNACQALPQLLTGGQPTRRHFEALKAAGVRVVLDLRAPGEPRGFDQPALLASLGMQNLVVPVGPTPLDDALLEQILDLLRRHAGETILVHCGSGNRVGGALIPYLILYHGMAEKDAVALAEQMGLRSPDLQAWGLDYARRHTAP